MKGDHKEYMQRETKRTFDQSMHLYEQTLNQVVQASGNGVSHDTSDHQRPSGLVTPLLQSGAGRHRLLQNCPYT